MNNINYLIPTMAILIMVVAILKLLHVAKINRLRKKRHEIKTVKKEKRIEHKTRKGLSIFVYNRDIDNGIPPFRTYSMNKENADRKYITFRAKSKEAKFRGENFIHFEDVDGRTKRLAL